MTTDKQLAHLSAITALNEMMRKGTFYISTVTEVAEAIGAVPDARAMRILRPLHCMKIGDLPDELRAGLPGLIARCISVPAYQFEVTPLTPERASLVQTGTIRLLTKDSA